MWRKPKQKTLFIAIGVTIAGLIVVQFYWIVKSIHLQRQMLERVLKEDIEEAVTKVEEDAYCFNYYSRGYIKDGEGIYILKQDQENDVFIAPPGGHIDTFKVYNIFSNGKDSVFSIDNKVTFTGMAATVDINMKFRFVGLNPNIKRTDTNSYDINGISPENFRQLLSNKFRVQDAINMKFLDKMIKKVLKRNRLDTLYNAGIKVAGSDEYEYIKPGSDTADLNKSVISAQFLKDRFNEPYELRVSLPGSFSVIIHSIWVIMITSIIVIIVLIISYVYFVRTILNQKRLSEMKNTFINNITHEFRTPITNINLAVENWKENSNNNGFYMRIIEEENRHMERNVEQILELATMEHAGSNPYVTLSKTNVHQLIGETVYAFDIQMQQLGGNISYRLNAVSSKIVADRHQLKTLLYNLIDNAIKYRQNRPPEINIVTYDTETHLIIEVSDNGIGMSTETQQHIFERFYRGYTGDTHNVKGFGLGLSFVKYIVAAHKGTIEVKSKPGRGSKFIIQLPKNINN